MLVFVALSFFILCGQSLGSDHLDKLLKKHPTWSFELVSVDAMIKGSIGSLKAIEPSITEDILRAKIAGNFGPETTHIVRKIGDPNWSNTPPATFDAREHWKECARLINWSQDEGACYTDGPVVAASVASDRYCIFTNGTFKEGLSAQMLASCGESCVKRPLMYRSLGYIAENGIPTGGTYNSNEGCFPYEMQPCTHSNTSYLGDEQDDVTQSVIDQGEPKPCEEIMKYDVECPRECSNPKYSKPLEKDLKKFTTWYTISENEFQIRNEILAYGPVTTSILLYNDFFKYPDTGMYRKKPGSNLVSFYKFFKLIGWGVENGTKYWLAVNTWDNWGPTKVFKIPRGEHYLMVEFCVGAGVYEDLDDPKSNKNKIDFE